jgi:NAD(P)H-hydrate epimerase
VTRDDLLRLASLPVVAPDEVPWLSVDEMRAIDEVMLHELGIELKQMMENAGRNLAVLARALLGGAACGRSVLVLTGPGGNGGGGLVAARHLHSSGAAVQVVLTASRERLAPVTLDQLAIVDRVGIPVSPEGSDLPDADLVVDAVLGYSQRGAPRSAAQRALEALASRPGPVLALDTPTGLELATGTLHRRHVRATATVTLAAPKHGLREIAAREAVGALFLADIGVPPVAYRRIGREIGVPFSAGPLVRLADA